MKLESADWRESQDANVVLIAVLPPKGQHC